MKMQRQGDVLIIPITTNAPNDAEPAPKDRRGLVLAEGETSGHHHQVFGRGSKLFHLKGTADRLLVVGKAGAEVRVVGGESGGVPRHHAVCLEPGRYTIRIQRSWSSERAQAERVAD